MEFRTLNEFGDVEVEEISREIDPTKNWRYIGMNFAVVRETGMEYVAAQQIGYKPKEHELETFGKRR